MKQILLATAFLIFSTIALALPVTGFISLEEGQSTFVDIQAGRRLPIRATRLETVESLKKLKNLDYFQGQGEVINNELQLESIDFVGLRRLLGVWTDTTSILDFKDYSKVVIYKSKWFSHVPTTSMLQYSIAPSIGADWKIFFTDESNVVLASLLLQDKKATLRFYDLPSGNIVKTVELTRLPIRN